MREHCQSRRRLRVLTRAPQSRNRDSDLCGPNQCGRVWLRWQQKFRFALLIWTLALRSSSALSRHVLCFLLAWLDLVVAISQWLSQKEERETEALLVNCPCASSIRNILIASTYSYLHPNLRVSGEAGASEGCGGLEEGREGCGGTKGGRRGRGTFTGRNFEGVEGYEGEGCCVSPPFASDDKPSQICMSQRRI